MVKIYFKLTDCPKFMTVRVIIGPSGQRLTIDTLPPPDTKRWVVRRKAEVVAAVKSGLLSREEACGRYSLSADELESWFLIIERHGIQGLRTTKTKNYRYVE